MGTWRCVTQKPCISSPGFQNELNADLNKTVRSNRLRDIAVKHKEEQPGKLGATKLDQHILKCSGKAVEELPDLKSAIPPWVHTQVTNDRPLPNTTSKHYKERREFNFEKHVNGVTKPLKGKHSILIYTDDDIDCPHSAQA